MQVKVEVYYSVYHLGHVVKRGLDWTRKTRTGLAKRGLDWISKTRTGLD